MSPGDTVVYQGENRTIIDIVDYTEEQDGGIQDVFYVLRLCDNDPNRKLDDEGGDIDIIAARAGECDKT